MLDNALDHEPNEAVDTLDPEREFARREALDHPPVLPIGDAVRVAADETGSGTAWLSKFWRCVGGPGKLTASEFFYYGLYRDEFRLDDLHRFIGKNVQTKMHRACCDPSWFAVARDKLLFLSVMRGAGVPVPETLAVYEPTMIRGHPRSISSSRGLCAFLDQQDVYPLFAKPIDGMYSIGVLALTDGGDGRAHAKGHGVVTSEELASYMTEMSQEGYLLQRMILPHPTIAEQFGGALATARLLVTLGDDGPEIASAVIKIPRVEHVADNFWRQGNMLGALDTQSGVIQRAITGTAAALREVTVHPDTGRSLVGFELPDWHAATSICLRGAGALPGLRTQSWDIAFSNKGPVGIEVNWGGDLNLHQLAHGKGVLSDGLIRHLKKNGYRGKLPGA